MWNAGDLTPFGRILITKSLSLSELVYSASNLNVAQEITPIATKLFNFLWKNKRDKIKIVIIIITTIIIIIIIIIIYYHYHYHYY